VRQAFDVTCSYCGRTTRPELVVGFDWRDHLTLSEVRKQFPMLRCLDCGAPVPHPSPILEFRPVDPVRTLVLLPIADSVTVEAAASAVASLLQTGVAVGPMTTLPARIGLPLLDQYTGFIIDGLDDDAPPDLQDWVRSYVEEVHPPNLIALLGQVIGSNDQQDAERVLEASQALLEPLWLPARQRYYRRLRERLDSVDARQVADARSAGSNRSRSSGPTRLRPRMGFRQR
jgi:hypothetical protein